MSWANQTNSHSHSREQISYVFLFSFLHLSHSNGTPTATTATTPPTSTPTSFQCYELFFQSHWLCPYLIANTGDSSTYYRLCSPTPLDHKNPRVGSIVWSTWCYGHGWADALLFQEGENFREGSLKYRREKKAQGLTTCSFDKIVEK